VRQDRSLALVAEEKRVVGVGKDERGGKCSLKLQNVGVCQGCLEMESAG
jgi:hypothetical protein